jgi:hypothetical protein
MELTFPSGEAEASLRQDNSGPACRLLCPKTQRRQKFAEQEFESWEAELLDCLGAHFADRGILIACPAAATDGTDQLAALN